MTPAPSPTQHAELFITPEGQILAHNITPEIAAILSELNRNDLSMKARAQSASGILPEGQSITKTQPQLNAPPTQT